MTNASHLFVVYVHLAIKSVIVNSDSPLGEDLMAFVSNWAVREHSRALELLLKMAWIVYLCSHGTPAAPAAPGKVFFSEPAVGHRLTG